MIKKLSLLLVTLLLSANAHSLTIYALGTSATNCRNVGVWDSFAVRLQELLLADGYNATVINGGIDGDRPAFMVNRVDVALRQHPDTNLVIFEPGPNERNKEWNLVPAGEVLDKLRVRKMPTIYVSFSLIQTEEEAAEFAKSYGAYYYGHWKKDVPRDRVHFQYDIGPTDGHMAGAGCRRWAENMLPLVKQVIKERNLK